MALKAASERAAGVPCRVGGGGAEPRWLVSPFVHFGVLLPNFGSDSSPSADPVSPRPAEELGFHSVWATRETHRCRAYKVSDPPGAHPPSHAWLAGWGWTRVGWSGILCPWIPFHLAEGKLRT